MAYSEAIIKILEIIEEKMELISQYINIEQGGQCVIVTASFETLNQNAYGCVSVQTRNAIDLLNRATGSLASFLVIEFNIQYVAFREM